MQDGASTAFEQAYTSQIVVDSHAQVIVATTVTQQANDMQQRVAMVEEVKAKVGRLPERASATSLGAPAGQGPTRQGRTRQVPPGGAIDPHATAVLPPVRFRRYAPGR